MREWRGCLTFEDLCSQLSLFNSCLDLAIVYFSVCESRQLSPYVEADRLRCRAEHLFHPRLQSRKVSAQTRRLGGCGFCVSTRFSNGPDPLAPLFAVHGDRDRRRIPFGVFCNETLDAVPRA